MAFAVTSIGSVGNTAQISAYTCALSRTPASDALVLVSVAITDTSPTVVEPTSVAGGGITFSLVTSSITFDGTSTNLSVWRAMGTFFSSIITASFPNNATGCAMLVAEVSGVSTAGTNGSSAVGQSANSALEGDASLTIIAPSATSTANAWYSVLASNAGDVDDAPNRNYTAVDAVTFATPSTTLESAWTTLSTGTITTWTGTGLVINRAGTLIELVLDNPAAVFVPSTITAVAKRPLRIPQVPSSLTGPMADYLRVVARQLNAEAYVSTFSGANPNTSGFTGVPGNLLVNIGSASTTTRLWVLGGGTLSIDTNDWHPVRIA